MISKLRMMTSRKTKNDDVKTKNNESKFSLDNNTAENCNKKTHFSIRNQNI